MKTGALSNTALAIDGEIVPLLLFIFVMVFAGVLMIAYALDKIEGIDKKLDESSEDHHCGR